MKHPNLLYRKALISDALGLESCMKAAYSIYSVRLDIYSLPPLKIDYKEEILHYPVWIVELDEKIVGGLILTYEEKKASLSNIAVHPNFHGMGIGRKLLEIAEREVKSRDFSEIFLATHVLLSENVRIYNHLGWMEYDRDEFRIYMKKKL